MESAVRPTKKQRELLTFIERFIGEHGYSPSYREIMAGLNYTSVATVALHVNSLIRRGHLHKRDHSARSLEITVPTEEPKVKSNIIAPNEEKWLVEKVEYLIMQVETSGKITQDSVDRLYIVLGALRVLGMEGAAQSFMPRLIKLKEHISS